MLYLFLMPKGYLNKAYSHILYTAGINSNNKQIKKRLGFTALLKILKKAINTFPDRRKGTNTSKSLLDAGLSAFSVFFTQSSSFLAHQKMMETNKGKNNARNLFGIKNIPTDNHIRYLLDIVSPECVYRVFYEIHARLKKAGLLESYKSYDHNTLCALDATQFFQSEKIKCTQCGTRVYEVKTKKEKNENESESEIKNKRVHYYHCVMTPVLVHPAFTSVISLPPEFIVPQDGSEKQDCEYNAAQRWFSKHAQFLSDLADGGVTILGDDLYCKQPFCEVILSQKFDFILVCKPDSHKTLYEYLDLVRDEIEEVKIKRWTGKRFEVDTYRFYNQLPIRNDKKDVLDVNWCEIVTTTRKKPDQPEVVTYKNSFATNFKITRKNVERIVADGRSRWKVENENYNVLKNRGYFLEHNFGHGKQYLSSLLVTFNLMAFLFHTILGLIDGNYAAIRDKLGKRETFFHHFKVLTFYNCFDSWEDMMRFMITGLELDVPDTS